ncbi:MAG: hypothetical protein H0Z32_08790 [Bacillaceae bacterium]|nr:hypothetical protein [Bacillaceae bacterium]
MKVFAAIVLIAVGVFHIAKPETIWYLKEGWKFEDTEPSDLYLELSRLFGVFLIVVAMFILLFAWLS